MSITTAGASAVDAINLYGQRLKARFDTTKGMPGQLIMHDGSGKAFPSVVSTLATKIRMATDDTTLSQAKGASQSFAEVFNTWYRFSHDNSGVYPAVPAETQTWTYDEATNSIRNTTNSATMIGLVGYDNFTDYDFDVTVSSNDPGNDDDFIGIVLGFAIKDGIEHTLLLVAQGYKQSDPAGHGFYRLMYNYNQPGGALLRTFAFTAPSFTWPEYPQGVRLRCVRAGNILTISTSEPMLNGAPNTLVHTFTFDLTSDARCAPFVGGARVGYCAMSQAYSTWSVLVRPETKFDIVDTRNKDLWRYSSNAWGIVGKADVVLPKGRVYKDLISNKSYVLHKDGVFYTLGGPPITP